MTDRIALLRDLADRSTGTRAQFYRAQAAAALRGESRPLDLGRALAL